MRMNFFGRSGKQRGDETRDNDAEIRNWREAGDRARDKRDWIEADRCYERHLKNEPADFAIWVQLGNCRKDAGDYSGALEAYERAIRLDERDPDVHLQRGHALKIAGRTSDAVASYSRSIECRAENNPALLELAALAPDQLAEMSDKLGIAVSGVRTVYFDITDLIDYVKGNVTLSGIQRVAANLIAHSTGYSRSAGEVSIVFVLPDYDEKRLLSPGALLIHALIETMLTRTPDRKSLDQMLSAIEASKQPVDARRGDILAIPGAFWIIHNFDLLRILRQRGVAIVPFIHDLIQARNPEYVHHGANEAFRVCFNDIACLSDRFLTSSKFVADEIKLYLGEKLNFNLDVVATPLATELGPSVHSQTDGEAFSFLLDGGFVLCVGTIEVRKNHSYLIRIWERLIREFQGEIPNLVLVGKWGWDVEDLRKYIQKSDYLGSRLYIYNTLPDGDLSWLYENCLFTVYPSFAEGWGLPISESLAFGKPCVASNATSVPEVGGHLSLYFDPHDLEDGYRVVSKILSDRTALADWSAKVKREFKPKSWRTFTEEFFDALVAAAKEIDFKNRAPHCVLETATVAPLGGAALAEMDARGLKLVTARMSRVSGWWEPESWGCWASQRRAVLRFGTRLRPDTDCIVYLHMRSPHDTELGDCVVRSGDLSTRLEHVGATPRWRAARCRAGEDGFVELVLLSGKGFRGQSEGAANSKHKLRRRRGGTYSREMYVGLIELARIMHCGLAGVA
ncbi:MAG: glycosyltransferase [Hyphomicrobiales bacterium]|nr:glycosyltransferase [Hyphomicrobiales bacterium]